MTKNVLGVQLKATERSGYEFAHGPFDYHVRREGTQWILDQFQSKTKDANAAYIASEAFPTLLASVRAAIEGGIA